MQSTQLEKNIYSLLDTFDKNNLNLVTFLEEVRLNILEQIKNNTELIDEFNNFINKEKNYEKQITIKENKIKINFLFIEKQIVLDKKESNFHTLEIVLSGKKVYRIYDKINKNKYLTCRLLPAYGVVYSSKTTISSITSPNTSLICLTMNEKS